MNLSGRDVQLVDHFTFAQWVQMGSGIYIPVGDEFSESSRDESFSDVTSSLFQSYVRQLSDHDRGEIDIVVKHWKVSMGRYELTSVSFQGWKRLKNCHIQDTGHN